MLLLFISCNSRDHLIIGPKRLKPTSSQKSDHQREQLGTKCSLVLLHQLESGTRDTMYDYACFVVSSLYTNDFIESSCSVKGIKLVNHYRWRGKEISLVLKGDFMLSEDSEYDVTTPRYALAVGVNQNIQCSVKRRKDWSSINHVGGTVKYRMWWKV